MSDLTTWLLIFGALLLAYAVYWGHALGRQDRGGQDSFLASRQIPAWQFVLAATSLSVTGWIALGHPTMIFEYGLPYGESGLGIICTSLAGVLFLKRQWLLGRRHQLHTPASLLGTYYKAELLRLLVLLVALVFAVPFVGMQLSACGHLIEQLTRGLVDRHGAAWIVGISVFVYVYLGGMRAVVGVGALQSVLMLCAMAGMGCVAYWQLGGVQAMGQALTALAQEQAGASVNLFEISGVMQFTAGLGKEAPAGNSWTSATVLGYALALMGLQAAPSFSMLGLASRDARGFAPQQVWACAGVIGFILLLFSVAEGMSGRLLGGPTTAADSLHAQTLLGLAASHPWLAALLAIGLIATVQFTAAACAWTTSAMFAQDVCQRYFDASASDLLLRVYARTAMAILIALSLAIGTFTPVAQAQLGTVALGFAVQLCPALAGLCWLRWLSRPGVTIGLCMGLVAVTLTEPLGGSIARFVGLELPWGRWPWTIHSAGWGLFVNLLSCGLISLVSRGGESRQHRDRFHDELADNDAMRPRLAVVKPALWAITLAWFFFALGPGAILGNSLFVATMASGVQEPSWALGVPSLWLWQMVWWVVGVFLVWWLAYKMELATAPRTALDLQGDLQQAEAAYLRPAERQGAVRTSSLQLHETSGADLQGGPRRMHTG